MISEYILAIAAFFMVVVLWIIWYLYRPMIDDYPDGWPRVKADLMIGSLGLLFVISLVVIENIDAWWKVPFAIVGIGSVVSTLGFIIGIAPVMVIGALIDLLWYLPYMVIKNGAKDDAQE